jgi:hypothetical protein
MADSGYEPEWLDMYDTGGRTFVNVVGRRASGQGSAFHGLTGAQYQTRFNHLTGSGYRPVIVESYLQNGQVRYAGFFKRISGPAFVAYHGLSASAHQTRFESLAQQGYQPRMISIVSVGGGLRVTGFYERRQGEFVLRSQVPIAQYQQVYNENANAGRLPVSLNGYVHNGQPMIAAIFSCAASGGRDRHGLSGAQYQNEWESATGGGLSTHIVTGYHQGGHRFAAAWRRAIGQGNCASQETRNRALTTGVIAQASPPPQRRPAKLGVIAAPATNSAPPRTPSCQDGSRRPNSSAVCRRR